MLVTFAVALAMSGLRGGREAVAADREPYQDAAVLALFTAAVVALVWFVSRWSLRPLARAAQDAARVGPAHPGARISADGLPTEIRPMVASVNLALDRMADAYAAERRFTANAAHELRTPLSVLSLRLQRAQAAVVPEAADWPGIAQDVMQMTRLVNQLLDLARKEQAGRDDAAVAWPAVNLSRLAREAAASVLPLAEAAGRRLEVDLPPVLAVRGRADDLRDMVLNLLDNAVRHGRGTIVLTGAQDGAMCRLDVADQGAGVPAELREAVFERFRKVAAHTEGSGLGLAIVREVVRVHGGNVGFRPGANSVVWLELPTA